MFSVLNELEKQASIISDDFSIKSAASTKVLNKMLNILERNPHLADKFDTPIISSSFAENAGLKQHLKGIDIDDGVHIGFPQSINIPKQLPDKGNLETLKNIKENLSEVFNNNYTHTAKDYGHINYNESRIFSNNSHLKAYDVSDRNNIKFKGKEIGPPTKHIALDTTNNPQRYDEFAEYGQGAGRDDLGGITGYESVATGKYLNKRNVGSFLPENKLIKNKEYADKRGIELSEIKFPMTGDKFQDFKSNANRKQWLRDYNEVGAKVQSKDLYNVKIPVMNPSEQTLNNLNHNIVFKGFRNPYDQYATRPQPMINDKTPYWVSSIPNVSVGYSKYNTGSDFVLKTKNKLLLETLDKQGLLNQRIN